MRDIKILLNILKQKVLDTDGSQVGGYAMCHAITDLLSDDIISYEEDNLLNDYLANNTPKYIYDTDGYWWHIYDQKSRLDWLEKEIIK